MNSCPSDNALIESTEIESEHLTERQPLHRRPRWNRPSAAHHARRPRHALHAARWTPDGSGIIFTQVDGEGIGQRHMAYIGADGTGTRFFTPEPISATHPQLRPVPEA
jgi:hypothetical protein